MEKSEKQKIQWHPAFCSAVRLELVENKEDLDYRQEYNLNKKPLQIDLLVIRKSKDVLIDNEIGKLFKGHNIMEYKSPEDSMGIDIYFKSLAYACLYKADGKTENSILAEDVTISMVREGYPRELIKYFKGKGYQVTKPYSSGKEEGYMTEYLREFFDDAINRIAKEEANKIANEVTSRNLVSSVENLAENLKISIEKACTLLNFTFEQYNKAKETVEQKNSN